MYWFFCPVPFFQVRSNMYAMNKKGRLGYYEVLMDVTRERASPGSSSYNHIIQITVTTGPTISFKN